MGTTGQHAIYYLPNGKVDIKKECDAYFLEGLNSGYYQVIESSLHGNIYYAAVKRLAEYRKWDNDEYVKVHLPEKEQVVFGVVVKTWINSRDHFNFYYKVIDETMGPCYYDCPKKILNALSPTDNEFALAWREKCKRHLEDKYWLRKAPYGSKLKVSLQDRDITLVKSKCRDKDRWIDVNNNRQYASTAMILSLGFEKL